MAVLEDLNSNFKSSLVSWFSQKFRTNIFSIRIYFENCMLLSTKQHQYEYMNLLKEQSNDKAKIKRKQNFIQNHLVSTVKAKTMRCDKKETGLY